MPDTPISSPPGMNITEQNKLKGSLFIEAYGSLIDGIGKDAESETEKALDITFNAIGAASATVMLVIDPLGSLIGAGIGWLIEHVSFLRDALNQLMGNPEEIQANVEANKARAAELRVLAEDHKNGLATFDGWTGQSSERFKASMDGMYSELDDLANAVETKAKIVAIMGMLVTVLRDIVRDLIAQLLGSLIGGAIIAAATMIPTFGASIPAFIGFAVGKAVALGTNIASRVARVIAALGRQMKRIGDLDDIMAKVSKGWNRFENVADVAEVTYEGVKASNGVDKKIDEEVQKNQSGGSGTTAASATAPTGVETVAKSRVLAEGQPFETASRPQMVAAEPLQAVSRTEMATVQPLSRTEGFQQAERLAQTEATPHQALRAAHTPTEPVLLARTESFQQAERLAQTEATPAHQTFRTAHTPTEPVLLARTESFQQAERLAQTEATPAYEALRPTHMTASERLQPTETYEAVEASQARVVQNKIQPSQ